MNWKWIPFFSGAIVLLLSFLQASFGEPWNDEVYYWLFAQQCDWGYLDHPPMVAWWIKAGTWIWGDNSFGIRFFFLLSFLFLCSAFLYLKSSLSSHDKLLLLLCIPAYMLAGFLAVPDTPLLFFGFWFFVSAKRFTEKQDFFSCFFLALSISGMLYSKYHGILPVICLVLFYPSLLLTPWFYLTSAIALLFFTPHLIWQYNHGFPSIAYHFFERSQSAYQWNFTSDYVFAQFLLLGTFISWLVFSSAWKGFLSSSKFDRFLAFVFCFVLGFFLLSSFKGHVEANWTAIALIPGIYLSLVRLERNPPLLKKIRMFLIPSLVLIIAGKCFFLIPSASGLISSRNEWHGSVQWASALQTKAGKLPVVFNNSYQKAARYMFYTGSTAISFNTVSGRRNQFEFWPYQDSMRYKDVLFVTGRRGADCDSVYTHMDGWIHVKKQKRFVVFMNIKLWSEKRNIVAKAKSLIPLNLRIDNPYLFKLPLPQDSIYAGYRITINNKCIEDFTDTHHPLLASEKHILLPIKVPAQTGEYKIIFTLKSAANEATINSGLYSLKVE
jgi:hypothetical protein